MLGGRPLTASIVPNWPLLQPQLKGPSAMQATTIGLDTAKSVFQVHGEDATGRVVLTKRLKRAALDAFFAKLPPALIGLEACGSAHHWGRRLTELGHDVRLIPPAHVKPFVKRNKTDARDAAAICEVVRRPATRTVPVKTVEEQSARAQENARDLLVRQRTALANATRAMLAEIGIIAAQGQRGFQRLAALIDTADESLPASLLPTLQALLGQWRAAGSAIEALEARLVARAKTHPVMRRLATIPGIGALTAHAIVAAIGDGRRFRCARDFAAWVGLTPVMHASGNRQKLGRISCQGDTGLRRLLVLGASAVVRQAKVRSTKVGEKTAADQWVHGVLARRPVKVTVIAQAAKNARIAWAVLTSGQPYQRGRSAAERIAAGVV
jgi:transposase